MTLVLIADMRETLAVLSAVAAASNRAGEAAPLINSLAVDLDDAEAALDFAVLHLPALVTAGGPRLAEDGLPPFVAPDHGLRLVEGGLS